MTRFLGRNALLLMTALFLCGGADAQTGQPSPPSTAATAIGGKVPNSNSLRDLRGNRRSLHDFKNHKAIVLVFLGADCPVSNLHAPGLIELEKTFRGKQVQFLGIYANENEDLEQIAGHAADRDFPFPVLKDSGHRLADLIGATRVPTVAVLDGDFNLRYRGRMSDQYGVSSRRPKATRADLAEALTELLAGGKITISETEADGCLLDRATAKKAVPAVDYAKHVAPILQNRCQTCHRPNQSAPFSLLTYADAAKHAAMIREVTTQRRMPPWHADPRFGHFANDRRLAAKEIDTLAAWVDGGLVRGDDKDLPNPAVWPQGWTQGKPDLVIEMPEEFQVPADGVVPYKNWIIPTNFKEDKWVRIAEARPGTAGVVHHVVIYIILKEGQKGPVARDGSMSILVGWAPGDLALVCPPDTALRVPKGASLRFEMHYTPNGTSVKDRSAVGITFAEKPPRYEMLIGEFANLSIEVPPHDPHYMAEAAFRLRADARILSFAPHMHWRGKDYRYEVIYPDGKRQTLLSVPRWDFNWQSAYRFQEPLKLPKGAKLHAVAHWDNSVNNPLNPDPSKSVRFGLQSWEEMMVGFVAYVWERPETAAELAKNPPSMADLFFDRLDVNGDDFITPNEVPAKLKPFIAAAGIKGEKMSRAEFTKLFDTFAPLMQPRRPAPPPGKDQPKKSSRTMPELRSPLDSTFLLSVPASRDRLSDAQGEKEAKPERIGLWNKHAPVGDGKFQDAEAWITVHHPKKPNGTAIVICPGGGYGGLVTGAEGHGIAAWLNRQGITGVVLEYRLPAGRSQVPLLDAQRAIRTVRANAKDGGLDPARIGIMGFSAGGHLASTAGTHFDAGVADSADPVERVSSRPDFMILVYPVITMGDKGHPGSRNNLLGKNPDAKRVDWFSNEKQVTTKTPPAFLAHAKDDRPVPPENSRLFYDALRAKKIAAEYLELPSGGHGLNGYKGPMWDAWQARSLSWLAEMKFTPTAK